MLGSIISLVVEATLSIKIVDRVNKTSSSSVTIAEILGLSAMAGAYSGYVIAKILGKNETVGAILGALGSVAITGLLVLYFESEET